MSRAASRRGILAALALSPAMVPAAAHAQPVTADGVVETIFVRWLDAMAENDMPGLTDDDHDRLDRITSGIEREVRRAPVCMARAGVLTLFALRFGIMSLSETPTSAQEDDGDGRADMDAIMSLAVLPCLLPYLTGSVARIAADFLAHPHRPIGQSLLFRSGGEA